MNSLSRPLCLLLAALLAACAQKPVMPASGGCGRPQAVAPCSCDKGVYPAEALQRREEGTTSLLVKVGVDGRATDVVVVNSSGSPTLDAAAVSALARACYKPDKDSAGQLTTSTRKVEFNWRLTPPEP